MANLVPQMGLDKSIQAHKLNANFISSTYGPGQMEGIGETPKGGFKSVMANLANDINTTVNAPDQLLQDAVTGNGVDIHDVIIAMNKAEIGVNVATQITTKIVQSYEKIMAIQV